MIGYRGHSIAPEEEDVYEGIDWEDARAALANSRLALVRTTRKVRWGSRFGKARRGHIEMVLATPGGHVWVMETFGRKGVDVAMEVFKSAQDDPIAWAEDADALTGTSERRLPFVHVLREAQQRRTGFIPGDAIETIEGVDLQTSVDGDGVHIAKGAQAFVEDVWIGEKGMIIVSPPGRDDLRVPLHPSQVEMLQAAPSPTREPGKLWVYNPEHDAWITGVSH